MKAGTEIKLAVDSNDKHIAKMMADGANMGIQSITKAVNSLTSSSSESRSLANKIINEEKRFYNSIWHNFVNYAKESDVEKRAILLSYVLTTLKTDRNSSLSDRPALPLVA